MAVGGQRENRREKTGPFLKKRRRVFLRIVFTKERLMPRDRGRISASGKGAGRRAGTLRSAAAGRGEGGHLNLRLVMTAGRTNRMLFVVAFEAEVFKGFSALLTFKFVNRHFSLPVFPSLDGENNLGPFAAMSRRGDGSARGRPRAGCLPK